MKCFAHKPLLGAIFIASVLAAPAQARDRRYQTTEEYVGATLAHTVDVGTNVAVDNTNAARAFCQRIGRDSTQEDVSFSSDTRLENRSTSDNGRGSYRFFSPPVEKRLEGDARVYSSVRLTCERKK